MLPWTCFFFKNIYVSATFLHAVDPISMLNKAE